MCLKIGLKNWRLRSIVGLVKKVEKLERGGALLEPLQIKLRMILIVVVGLVHIRKRGMRNGQGGDIFGGHQGILSIEWILMIGGCRPKFR